MDALVEAYRKVHTESKELLDESYGNTLVNNINKLSVSIMSISQELKEHVKNEDELQELSESIRVSLNKLKQIVEKNTGI